MAELRLDPASMNHEHTGHLQGIAYRLTRAMALGQGVRASPPDHRSEETRE